MVAVDQNATPRSHPVPSHTYLTLQQGELVFKAIGFTPWPVSSDERGERIRIDVGPVQKLEPRFDRIFGGWALR